MAFAATATFSGRSLLWALVKSAGSPTEPKNIGWGTGGGVTGSANSDVNLFAPATEARTAGTSSLVSTSQLADTYQVTGSIVCAGGGKTITEAALFDTATSLSPTATISNSLTTASTVVTVSAWSPANAPGSGNYYVQLQNEVALVTAGQGTTTITVTRAQLGSTAAVAASGTPITIGGDGLAHANATLGGQTATVSNTVGGNIFAHADFAGIALNVSDSINFTWKDQLT